MNAEQCGYCRGECPIVRAQLAVTEEDAWKAFYSNRRDAAKAQRGGDRMELMTHERYCREVAGRMTVPCPHARSGAV